MIGIVSRCLFLLALALAGAAAPLTGGAPGAAVAQALQRFETETIRIRSGGRTHAFHVEIARSAAQQSQGLMYRRRMAADAGMLFLHGTPRRASMWMKNTFIPLDMVFIAPNGRIDQIVERTTPHSEEVIASANPVAAVLELNGGTVSRLGIRPGDRVLHQAFAAPG
jgi:uncharacterized membrane protein (UPF0127 family)